MSIESSAAALLHGSGAARARRADLSDEDFQEKLQALKMAKNAADTQNIIAQGQGLKDVPSYIAAGVLPGQQGMQVVAALEAGVVWVNCFGDGDMTQPFGGYKQSGNSRDKHMMSLLSYTQSKSAWFHLG